MCARVTSGPKATFLHRRFFVGDGGSAGISSGFLIFIDVVSTGLGLGLGQGVTVRRGAPNVDICVVGDARAIDCVSTQHGECESCLLIIIIFVFEAKV